MAEALEKWALGQPKTASIAATWYPYMSGGTGANAGTELNIMTPDQSALAMILPGGKVIYGTYGLGHAAGIVHGLTLRQVLKITEDEPNPDGTIAGATSSGYQRTISLELLATGRSRR